MFRTTAMFAERGNKQQQQQFSHKESRWTRSKRSVHKSQMPKVAPKGTKHRPSSAALPAAVPHRPCRRAPPHPPPPQHPARRRMAAASSAVAPQSRWWASDIALRRPACASPTLSMRALPARAPCGRRLNPPSEPARGSSYRPAPSWRWHVGGRGRGVGVARGVLKRTRSPTHRRICSPSPE